jgi:predicted transcriptional regulator
MTSAADIDPRQRRSGKKTLAATSPLHHVPGGTPSHWNMIMSNGDDTPTVPSLTTEIVAAYVGHHTIATGDVAALITSVARELEGLGREPEQPARPEPVVSVRRSVQRDHLVCLVCGKKFKSLRRHLQTAHALTPEAYREMFGLKPDYPMVAAASSEQRAEIARRTGLGQRRAPEPAPEPKRAPRAARKAEAATAAGSAPKRRGRKPKTAAEVATDAAPVPIPKRKPRTAKKAEPTPA